MANLSGHQQVSSTYVFCLSPVWYRVSYSYCAGYPPAVSHLQTTLNALQIQPNEEEHYSMPRQMFTTLMNDAMLTPRFNHHYRISTPLSINGVQLNPRGWFKFTEIWLSFPSQ